MACAHPYKILPSVSVNGRSYFYKSEINCPCYRCVNCVRDRQNYIIDRANYEYCSRLVGAFVTFTYNDIFLIDRCAVRDPLGGFMYDEDSKGNTVVRTSLRYDDLTHYLDSIRHYVRRFYETHPDVKVNPLMQPDFSYMYCGEYGSDKYPDLLGRCHFHVLFFGLDFAFCKDILFNKWKYGFIDVRPILDGGIRYVTKYMDQFEQGDLAEIKYDFRGIARPKLRMSVGFGQGLLWTNIDDIYANDFTYKIEHGKRRPISAYWRSLVTSSVVSRDPRKKSWNEFNDRYKVKMILATAEEMRSLNLHRKMNIFDEKKQSEFKLYKARLRESQLIAQAHQNLAPVPDLESCFSHKYGWLTWYGEKVNRLPTAQKRLLAEEYRHRLEERYLYLKFPDLEAS